MKEEMLEDGVGEGKRGVHNGRGDEPQWIIKKEDHRHMKEGGMREKYHSESRVGAVEEAECK